MMLTISSNAGAVAQLFEEATEVYPAAVVKSREALAEEAYKNDKAFLQEIYDQPDTAEVIGGDYLGEYLAHPGGDVRSGALKAAETLIQNEAESLITTKSGLISGPRGTKTPEDYVLTRMKNSRPAGEEFRERAAEKTEHEGGPVAEAALKAALPAALFEKV